jgi:hypothetical protein
MAVILISFWAIFTGVMEIAAGIRLRQYITMLILMGITAVRCADSGWRGRSGFRTLDRRLRLDFRGYRYRPGLAAAGARTTTVLSLEAGNRFFGNRGGPSVPSLK